MYIPSQEQWQKVIDTLKSVLPMAPKEENFNMDSGIHHNHPCGTVCCVAGWYVVANSKPEEIANLRINDWLIGKQAIANDLGFDNDFGFKTWANSNVDLWGNDLPYNMFTDPGSYNSGVPDAYAKTLADVINHFEYVKKQCYAYANQTAVADGN